MLHLSDLDPAGRARLRTKRYWLGSVWAMIVQGFSRHGHEDLAADIRQTTAKALSQYGFGEYFDPTTDDALGG